MLIPAPVPGPLLTMWFSADAMFYSGARKARERAERATKDVDRAERGRSTLQVQIDALQRESESGDRGPKDDAILEALAIQMDDQECEVLAAYGSVFRELAIVQILTAQALEAHINIRAEAVLTGQERDAFSSISAKAKWLFFSKLVGGPGFDPGAEPFQGFVQLITARNSLVHYKTKKQPYDGYAEPEKIGRQLGLTLEKADRAIQTAKGMIEKLAEHLGDEQAPWWLESDSSHFFDWSPPER